jgi:hypothetical protein
MRRTVNIGYSLLIDEYIDANQLEPADCELLKVCCPVCLKPVERIQPGRSAALSHVAPAEQQASTPCESRIQDFTLKYREEQNVRARAQRVEFLQWDLFKELLNKDPITSYETHAVMVLGNLKFQGALLWLPDWHLEMVVDVYSRRLGDKVEFWGDGEAHLAQFAGKLSHIPPSGYGRQVHFQIAYDLMQHLLSRKGFADDNYSWLFTHAFRLCTQKWRTEARIDEDDGEEYPRDADGVLREKIAAARIIVSCCCDLLSRDKKEHKKGIKILTEMEMKPPLTPIVMPLLIFMGIEIMSVMKTTLFRLPYLPMLRLYERPCRPRVA